MKWMSSMIALLVLSVTCLAAQDLFVRIPADPPVKNPLEADEAAITAGMGAYRQRCADCHGMDARGIRSPDITQVWARGRSDGALFETVRRGIPGTEMPAHPAPRTSDTDIWRILAYLKTLAVPAPSAPSPGNATAGEIFSPPTASGATGWAIAEGTSDLTSRGSAQHARARRWRVRSAATCPTSGPATSRSR